MSSFFAQTKDNMRYLHADMSKLSPKKRRKKRRAVSTLWGLGLVAVQLVIMILFMFQVLKLDMVPAKYLIMVNIILILLLLYNFTSQFTNANIFGKILSVLLSVAMLFGFFFVAKVNTTLSQITNSNVEGQVEGTYKKLNEEPFIIYLSGMDDEGEVTLYGHNDVNIYVVCNPKTRQILLVTTPRDAFVQMTGNGGKSGLDKLTHAGNAGVDEAMTVLDNIYGIRADYYVRLNFTGCVNIVDALGGITVNSEVEFTNGTDAWDEQYHYVRGENKLDGQQTIAYVRERQAFDDGDFQRGKNQEAALEGIINKATSPSILLNYGAVLDSVSAMMLTNMPTSAISTLVKDQLSDTTSWNIQSYSVEATPYEKGQNGQVWGIVGMDVVKLNDDSVDMAIELMNKIKGGETFNVDEFVEQAKLTSKNPA
ncbi:MAG: LCP family protein [Eubacteriales bacterium]|nr:LCP family protein [Eubacteriales bacterium]